jgi:hypothetical protein
MRSTTPAVIGGLGTAALGLLYANYVFGPTEAEVATWGEVALVGGIVLILGAIGSKWTHSTLVRLALALICSAVALLHLPPVVLWALFHGSGISDGSPSSGFVAHWAYLLPHLLVAATCLFAAYWLVRRIEAPSASLS